MPLFFVFVVLLMSTTGSAQSSKAPSGGSEKIKQNLLQIEREIGRANSHCDYKYFDIVEAKEFVFTDSNGGVTNKKEDMAGEKGCRKNDFTYDLGDTHVSLYGRTAVVTGRATTTGMNKEGKLFTHQSRFTDVFVWRDGRWQIVAGHSSQIPEKK